MVSGLMGIIPPLSKITSKLSANPSPSSQKPGRRIFTIEKIKSSVCDPMSNTGIHEVEIEARVAGWTKAKYCGIKAMSTNQAQRNSGS